MAGCRRLKLNSIAFVLLLVLLAAGLSSCGSGNSRYNSTDEGRDTLRIVTDIFPAYDWVRVICGENPGNAEVTMLLDNGVDLHSFQPTVDDILQISTCDLFIYVGGESAAWAEDAIAEAANEDLVVINLLEILGDEAREEELAEGMRKARGEGEEEPEKDEHVWLSLKNAAFFTDCIAETLSGLDSENADVYRNNAEAYEERLSELDEEYRLAVSASEVKTLLFADRFPFRYLFDDCGLDYYAAFAGCSAETEASFETIVFLADKVNELSLHSILIIDGNDGKLARTVRSNTGTKDQKILTLDSMQSVAKKDASGGVSYLSVMEDNLEVLKEALK